MIPSHQKIMVAVLVLAATGMGAMLWRMRQHAHERLLAGEDSAPTHAPAEVAPAEQVTLVVANDADGSLLLEPRSLPLPPDPGARARVLLGTLLDLYADPDASHPVQGGAASVAQVFLLPAPHRDRRNPDALLAVVNLTGSFAGGHPSGLEAETLTLLSICGTLRANLPRITEVRFLVDGRQRPNLAGHADLTRTYLTADVVPTGGGPAE